MIRWSLVISVLIVILLTPYIILAEAGDILWTTNLGDEIYESTPAIGENIYVGNIDHHLYSISSANGEEIWSVDLGLPILMSPTILGNGNILCASKTDSLYCISPAGETLWKKDLMSDVINCAIINSEEFLVSIDNGSIFKMNINGTLLQTYYTSLEISKGPFITADGSVVLLGEDSSINVFDSEFSLLWQDDAEDDRPPSIVGNFVYYRSRNHLNMKSTNEEQSLSIHEFDSESGVGDLVDFEGNRYVTLFGMIVKFSPNGTYIWHYVTDLLNIGYPVLSNQGDIYFATYGNEVSCLNNSGELQWSCQLPNPVNTGLKLDNSGNLIVACRYGEVICIETNGEEIAPWGYSSLGGDLNNSHSKKADLYANINEITNFFALVETTYRDTVTIYNCTDSGILLAAEDNSDLIEINVLGSNMVAAADSTQIEIIFYSDEPVDVNEEILIKSLFTGSVFPILYKTSASILENGTLLSFTSFPGDDDLSLPALLNDEIVLVNLETAKTIAYDLSGNELWKIDGYVQSHPIALENGNFILTYPSHISCFDAEANELWEFECMQSSYISADRESNTYIGNWEHVQKINSEGEVVWEYDCNSISPRGKVTIAPDGTLYFPTMAEKIIALTTEGILKRIIDLEYYASELSIDNEGFVYAYSADDTAKLYRFDPAGNIVAEVDVDYFTSTQPFIANDYVYRKGSNSRVFKYDKATLNPVSVSPMFPGVAKSELTIDSNGKYFVASTEMGPWSCFNAMNPDNTYAWQFDPLDFNLFGHIYGSPLILPDGNIAVSTNDVWGGANLYFFKEEATVGDDEWATLEGNMKRNSSLPLTPETGANLCLYEDYLDFGSVAVDTDYSLYIWLHNTGVEDLIISTESNSEIFTAIPSFEASIPPQDSLLLVVTCNIPAAQSDIYYAEITIHTNDDDFPLKVIECKVQSNNEGVLMWVYEYGALGNPALDTSGNIYLLSSNSVKSISSEGVLNWETNLYRPYLSAQNVTINNNNSTIIAPPATILNFQGDLLEEFTNLSGHTDTSINSHNALIFASTRASDPGIYSYASNGDVYWANESIGKATDAIVIDENDRLYFHTIEEGYIDCLYSFNANGDEIWSYLLNMGQCNPVIGYDQKFYYQHISLSHQDNLMLACMGYDGSVIWHCNLPDDRTFVAPVIDNQGNIYQACDNGKFCCISDEGEILWIYDTHSQIAPPAIGANGCIYFGTSNSNLYALNPDGSLRWTYEALDPILGSITISPEGVLYFTDSSERLYAVSSECGGLADSPWPMMHQNPQHTNRLPREYQTSLNEIIDIPQTTISNYPNPFNPETTITFSLPTAVKVNLEIYNVKGQMVKSIYAGKMEKGEHSLKWNGLDESNKSVSSGVYFYQLSTTDESIRGKMLLMK